MLWHWLWHYGWYYIRWCCSDDLHCFYHLLVCQQAQTKERKRSEITHTLTIL